MRNTKTENIVFFNWPPYYEKKALHCAWIYQLQIFHQPPSPPMHHCFHKCRKCSAETLMRAWNRIFLLWYTNTYIRNLVYKRQTRVYPNDTINLPHLLKVRWYQSNIIISWNSFSIVLAYLLVFQMLHASLSLITLFLNLKRRQVGQLPH